MERIVTKGLSAGSLYKLLFLGLLPPLFIFSLTCGIASYFGYHTVTFNDHYIFGFKGLILGSILGFVLPLFFAAFLWCLIGLGLWLWSLVSRITLIVKV